jgi:hypothetical protein
MKSLLMQTVLICCITLPFTTLNTKRWMSHPQIKQKTLREITLLGSHDSTTYSMKGEDIQGLGIGTSMLIGLFRVTGYYMHSFIQNWAVTQTLTVKEQLEAGVRYLDLRIGLEQSSNTWKMHHGMIYGAGLKEILAEVKEFLQENPSEIVILGASHIMNFNMIQLKELIAELNREFEGFLFKRTPDWKDIPLEELAANNKRFVFIFKDIFFPCMLYQDTVWFNKNNDLVLNSYANKDNYQSMMAYNRRTVVYFKSYDKLTGSVSSQTDQLQYKKNSSLFLMSWTLTPNGKTVFRSMFPYQNKCTKDLYRNGRHHLFDFINKQKLVYDFPIMGNVLIFDFIDQDYAREILQVILDLPHQEESLEVV